MKIALVAGMALAGVASADIVSQGPVVPNTGARNGQPGPAAVLWDQPPNATGNNAVDQNFSDFPTFSTFMVTDVSFGSGVVIEEVTTYYTFGFGGWPGAGSATLNIFPKTGASPVAGDDPFTGISVPVTIALGASGLEVTAAGLSIALAAGEYWVGLTPELAFGAFGQEFHLEADPIGDQTHLRNPGGGFSGITDWMEPELLTGAPFEDGAITIRGTPAPASLALLGLGGLVATRRRR